MAEASIRAARCPACASEIIGICPDRVDTSPEEFARIGTAKRHAAFLNCHVGRPEKLLDIGCASGLFLDQAARSGWDVFGVEPNPVLSTKADGRVGKNRVWSATL